MRYFLLSAFILSIGVLKSQIRFEYNSLIEKDSAVLYKGISNDIKVNGINVDESYGLYIIQDTVIKEAYRYKGGERNDYFFSIQKGGLASLNLVRNNDTILSQIARVERLPDLRLQYGQIRDSVATKAELTSDPNLRIILDDCLFDHGFQVISFELSFIIANKDTLNPFDKINGSSLGSRHLEIIRGLKRGDKVMFKRVKVTCPDCAIRELSPMIIRII